MKTNCVALIKIKLNEDNKKNTGEIEGACAEETLMA
jgi:hypothetical protein